MAANPSTSLLTLAMSLLRSIWRGEELNHRTVHNFITELRASPASASTRTMNSQMMIMQHPDTYEFGISGIDILTEKIL